jgi:LacI family transcriptional regulator
MNIHEFAKALRLSVSTVSRALNGYADVNAETRAKVIEAAKRLGYTANPMARGLRKRGTGFVAFVLSPPQKNFANPFFLDLLVGIEERLRETELKLMVVSANSFEDEMERFKSLVEIHRVEGLIFARTRLKDPRIEYLQKHRVPFVTHGRSKSGAAAPFLDIDHEIVGHEGCARFIALGHRRIALLNTPSELMYSHHRLDGYRRALKAAGLPLDSTLMVEEDLTEEGGANGVRRLMAIPDPPTAILCGHDMMAMGAMRALHEHGRMPGRDVGIIGSDDNPLGPYMSPPLTTFTAPRVSAGRRMTELLIEAMDGASPESLQELWKPTLLIRASDGPPRELATPAKSRRRPARRASA